MVLLQVGSSSLGTLRLLVRRTHPSLFRGRHFADQIIILACGGYLKYKLSYRDIRELMVERGSPSITQRFGAGFSGMLPTPAQRHTIAATAKRVTNMPRRLRCLFALLIPPPLWPTAPACSRSGNGCSIAKHSWDLRLAWIRACDEPAVPRADTHKLIVDLGNLGNLRIDSKGIYSFSTGVDIRISCRPPGKRLFESLTASAFACTEGGRSEGVVQQAFSVVDAVVAAVRRDFE